MTQEENKKELWELHGDIWTLPILVRWEGEVAIITLPDIPLLTRQRQAAVAVLEQWKNADGEYAAREEALRQHAKRSKERDVEAVVDWRRTVPPAVHFKTHPNIDAFLDAFVAKGGCPSRPIMSALWQMLLTHMMDWVINRKQPLDLYFCTIVPLCARRNWKEVVLGKMVHSGYCYAKPDKDEAAALKMMEQMDITGITEDGNRVVWTLECVPNNRIADHLFDEIEKKVRNRKRAGYWFEVRHRLKAQVPHARMVFWSYCEAIRAKAGALPLRTVYRRGSSFAKFRPKSPPKAFVVPLVLSDPEEPGGSNAVAQTDAPLPTLPGVQPEAVHVRDSGQDIPERDGESPVGVPVLHADQSGPAV